MSRLVVDLDELAGFVARIDLVTSTLIQVHDDVADRVQHLHLRWLGDAADAHAAAHVRWSAAAGQLDDALTVLRTAVAATRANFVAAVEANRAMWTQ